MSSWFALEKNKNKIRENLIENDNIVQHKTTQEGMKFVN